MDDKLAVFMPVMGIEGVAERRNAIVEFVEKAMKRDVDYGIIPGATKPTLLKPGAEKLCTLFGLSPHFTILKSVEDWTGKDFNGEPFFYYLYHCSLYRGDYLIGEGDGSCNSRETKYRYRNSNRVCPKCGKETIIKGKEEFGGGWLCFAKRGGCGEKFTDSDTAITSQQVGRVANLDSADQANTILKMAEKRALIAATLIAVNASEFYTQDIEDMVIEGTATVVTTTQVTTADGHPVDTTTGEVKEKSIPPKAAAKTITDSQKTTLFKLYKEIWGGTEAEIDEALKTVFVSKFKHPAEEATTAEASTVINEMLTKIKEKKGESK